MYETIAMPFSFGLKVILVSKLFYKSYAGVYVDRRYR
jgi:hypothetical protein